MKSLLKTVLLSTSLVFAGTAQAALIASLSFVQPTGTVFSNQSIDIVVRLTLDPESDALTTDGSGTPTSGFDPATYFGAIDLSDPNTRIFLNEGAECSGTLNPCSPGAYAFNFNYGLPNFISPANFDLQPGNSFDWVLGSFSPVGGNAAPGNYTFYNAGVHFQFFNPGADLLDSSDDQNDFLNITDTCRDQNPVCAFSREVLAAPGGVPEPASWALMLTGFGLVGAAARRRSKALPQFS
jgi:PEP-CTERM motif